MVETIDDLIDCVRSYMTEMKLVRASLWFRRHARSSYSLLPSLLRIKLEKSMRKLEKNIVADFLVRAGAEIGDHQDSWEILSRLRHYELHSRLLDWSSSLTVALYFALMDFENIDSNDPPAIWMLYPHALNKMTVREKVVFDVVDRVYFDYIRALSYAWQGGDSAYKYCRTFTYRGEAYEFGAPIAISLPLNNPRIRAQRGRFTLHMDGFGVNEGEYTEPVGLEAQADNICRKIVLSEKIVKKCRLWLQLDGDDSYFLFPELEKLSESIIKHRLGDTWRRALDF